MIAAVAIAPMSREEMLEQITAIIEQLHSEIARTSAGDRAAFAELSKALRVLLPLSDELAK